MLPQGGNTTHSQQEQQQALLQQMLAHHSICSEHSHLHQQQQQHSSANPLQVPQQLLQTLVHVQQQLSEVQQQQLPSQLAQQQQQEQQQVLTAVLRLLADQPMQSLAPSNAMNTLLQHLLQQLAQTNAVMPTAASDVNASAAGVAAFLAAALMPPTQSGAQLLQQLQQPQQHSNVLQQQQPVVELSQHIALQQHQQQQQHSPRVSGKKRALSTAAPPYAVAAGAAEHIDKKAKVGANLVQCDLQQQQQPVCANEAQQQQQQAHHAWQQEAGRKQLQQESHSAPLQQVQQQEPQLLQQQQLQLEGLPQLIDNSSAAQQQNSEGLTEWFQANTSELPGLLTTDQRVSAITLTCHGDASTLLQEVHTVLLQVIAADGDYQACDALAGFTQGLGTVASQGLSSEVQHQGLGSSEQQAGVNPTADDQGSGTCITVVHVGAVAVGAAAMRNACRQQDKQQQLDWLQGVVQRCLHAAPALCNRSLALSVGAVGVSWDSSTAALAQVVCPLSDTYTAAAAAQDDIESDDDVAAALLLLSGSQARNADGATADDVMRVGQQHYCSAIRVVRYRDALQGFSIAVPWHDPAAATDVSLLPAAVLVSGTRAVAQMRVSIVQPNGSSSSSSSEDTAAASGQQQQDMLLLGAPYGAVCEEGVYRVFVQHHGVYFLAAHICCVEGHDTQLKDVQQWLTHDPNLLSHFEVFHANTMPAGAALPQHKQHLHRSADTAVNIAGLLVSSCIEQQQPAVLGVLFSMLGTTKGCEGGRDLCSLYVDRNSSGSFDVGAAFTGDDALSQTYKVMNAFMQEHRKQQGDSAQPCAAAYEDYLAQQQQWQWQQQQLQWQQQQLHSLSWQEQQSKYSCSAMHDGNSSRDMTNHSSYNAASYSSSDASLFHASAAAAAGTGSSSYLSATRTADAAQSLAGTWSANAHHHHHYHHQPKPAKAAAARTSAATASKAAAAAAAALSHHGTSSAAAAAAASMPHVFDLNLPKPKIKTGQMQQLIAQGVVGDQDVSMHFYKKRGPQAMRRTLVRRLTGMFPEADRIYTEINTRAGLSQKGQQWLQCHCEEFFTHVLGPQGFATSAPWPLTKELKPVMELGYISRLLTWLLAPAGRDVSSVEANDCFVPGHHDWKVDAAKLEALLGVSVASVKVPLLPITAASDAAAAAAVAAPATLPAVAAAAPLSPAPLAADLPATAAAEAAAGPVADMPIAAATAAAVIPGANADPAAAAAATKTVDVFTDMTASALCTAGATEAEPGVATAVLNASPAHATAAAHSSLLSTEATAAAVVLDPAAAAAPATGIPVAFLAVGLPVEAAAQHSGATTTAAAAVKAESPPHPQPDDVMQAAHLALPSQQAIMTKFVDAMPAAVAPANAAAATDDTTEAAVAAATAVAAVQNVSEGWTARAAVTAQQQALVADSAPQALVANGLRNTPGGTGGDCERMMLEDSEQQQQQTSQHQHKTAECSPAFSLQLAGSQ